ncbi:sulfatase-like hydrolase/transferase [Nonomuraea sp. K274]|uniref:Sulfatase-like hydrolase/transferase n=1 Tax=Nonomuraea cypriaca TaxID=1187855 RepID=A0A931AIY7_9ACTN|nr:sulfatase-like hydrolase/transferase [Nonomuraea cypriaca]MBF8193872.1 sulfatase-like hydrolase/transferase [Nonomuraea cypriaca]
MTTAPNILLITTDQQRHDTIGPRAPEFLRTPHLDHLAREGVRFDAAYAQTAICVPARTSIMTGQSPFAHGMTCNGSTSDVMGRDDTLPAVLRGRGYGTAAIGKMHFTPPRARHGFDELVLPDDYYRWMRESGIPERPMRTGLGQNELYPGTSTVPESLTLTSWIAEESVRYIRDRRDPTAPFFLWTSFSKPHPPLDPPEPYASMYRDAPIPEPVFGDWSGDDRCPEAVKRWRQRQSYDLVPPGVIKAARAAYYGLVTHIDYAIGHILAALQDVGLFDDTLIVFTSDHGEYLGDHHTGSKVFFHDASARLPFLLRPPKSWHTHWHGTASEALATHADILPTLLAAAGGRPGPGVEGQNLLAVLSGDEPPRSHLCATATEAPSADPLYHAITDGRHKYIWYPEGPASQLFDLADDPLELTDLSGEERTAGVQEDLRRELVRHLNEYGSLTCDRLPETPPRGDSTADRRARSWPGYHTEWTEADVRH